MMDKRTGKKKPKQKPEPAAVAPATTGKTPAGNSKKKDVGKPAKPAASKKPTTPRTTNK